MPDVILHAFNWKYQDIIRELPEIKKSGFGSILIAPPLYSDPGNIAWWQRYQPIDYRILLSYLGGKKDLEKLIKDAHSKGLKVYADIVLNHMANESRDHSLRFPGGEKLKKYRDNRSYFAENRIYGDLDHGLFCEWDFNQERNIGREDWNSRYDVQYRQLDDLPDLKDNEWVLRQQRELFWNLNEMEFDGYRLDAIKHMTERQVDNIADQRFMQGKFMFGEVLTTNETQIEVFMKPFLSETHISAYDFPLQEQIRKAFCNGGSLKSLINPFAYGKALHWARAVTFVVNHDLPLNDGFRSLMPSPEDEHLANVYIMGRDGGVPLVFSDNNESVYDKGYYEDRDRWAGSHKRADFRAMIQLHNEVIGEPMVMLYEHDNYLVFRRGDKGIVAINKSSEWVHADIWLYGLRNPATYKELIHRYEMQLTGQDRLSLAIAPRSAQMWLAEIKHT